VGKLLLYDALDMTFQTVKLRKNPRCKVCGEAPSVTELIDYEQFCGVPARGSHMPKGIPEITPAELRERLNGPEPVTLIDVREAVEQQVSSIPGARLIPLGQIPTRLDEMDRGQEVILYCRSGVRSAQAAEILLTHGFQRVRSLRGGVNAWAKEVDPSVKLY
jgi:adenylyltransferase/sulfurtransferase